MKKTIFTIILFLKSLKEIKIKFNFNRRLKKTHNHLKLHITFIGKKLFGIIKQNVWLDWMPITPHGYALWNWILSLMYRGNYKGIIQAPGPRNCLFLLKSENFSQILEFTVSGPIRPLHRSHTDIYCSSLCCSYGNLHNFHRGDTKCSYKKRAV